MTGVRIEISGAEPALAFLGEAAAKAANPRGLYAQIGAALVASTQNRFLAGQAPDGSPWPASIRALAEGGKTLIDTGRLMGSITYEASDDGVAVGTNVQHAATHQFGETIRPVSATRLVFQIGDRTIFATKVTIPARPFLGLDEDDKRDIPIIVEDWLLGEENRGAPQ